MKTANMIILYVENTPASAAFYTDLIGRPPVEASNNFAMFALDTGMMLGLWKRGEVQPKATPGPASAEIVFTLDGAEAVDALSVDWRKRGLTIAQEPAAMDFGYTFVALDPDGHRLRGFAPAT